MSDADPRMDKGALRDILLERRGSAAWITFNRPAELNPLGERLAGELNEALDQVEADAALRCVVITGAGRAFCAGADLKFVNAIPEAERAAAVAAFLQSATRLMSRLEAFPKPVIAAVNGIATAAGMEVLLCCDLVVAAESARLGDGHANFGLLPGAGGSMRLPRRIGLARAKHLFFTGALVPARDLLAAGLVNQVVPDAELVATVDALAETIATKSPLALARIKALANAGHDLSLDQGLALEQTVSALHTLSYDRNEGLQAFVERRKPVFLGR